MKRTIAASFFLALCVQAFAQSPVAGILNRFSDPDKGHVVFIEKGSRAIGIKGGYRNFATDGYADGDGYSLLSLVNIGDGNISIWNVTPKFSWFVADDFSLGVNLDYSGYNAVTNINLDFREIIPSLYRVAEEYGIDSSVANVAISSRSMQHHAWGVGFSARKYLSFFGSRTFGIFGEARLSAKYGITNSTPRDSDLGRFRFSQTAQVGIDLCGGLAVRLKEGSAIMVSVPLFGVAWNGSWQDQTRKFEVAQRDEDGKAVKDAEGNIQYRVASVAGGGKMSSIKASRSLDLVGIQIGYSHYIKPKKKH